MSDLTLGVPASSPSFGRVVFKAIGSSSLIAASLISVTMFTVMNGNMVDRFTHGLFGNSSALFAYLDAQGLGFVGYLLAFLIACIIVLAPFDYILGFNIQEAMAGNYMGCTTNYDFVFTMIGIYFVTAFIIGMTMRHTSSSLGGFLLGFFAIVYLDIIIYTVLYAIPPLIATNAPEAAPYMDLVQSYSSSFLAGVYGEPLTTVLVKSALLNGTIMGIFGAFWTAVLMPSRVSGIGVIACPIEAPLCRFEPNKKKK